MTVRHGGDLSRALAHYGGEKSEWLDLSTGISPWHYPAPPIDQEAWRQLPPPDAALIFAASAYYGCNERDIAAVPGSQLAIRLIPQLLKEPHTVAIPLIGYQEHAESWKIAGHSIVHYKNHDELIELIEKNNVNSAVVINPNNPTGDSFKRGALTKISNDLSGLLLVDEAFSDLQPEESLCTSGYNKNIIILKSIGKFFGLAGARVGFAIGKHPLLKTLKQLLSPWTIASPSLMLATLALRDIKWQSMQRSRIASHAKQQAEIITQLMHDQAETTLVNQGLFFSIMAKDQDITQLHIHLAEQKIWSRLGDIYKHYDGSNYNWIRLSLAGDDLNRLSLALKSF